MKNIMALLLNTVGWAQVKGNKVIVSRTCDLENVLGIKIDIYAKIIVDAGLKNEITITADENIINLIDTKVENGILYLNQMDLSLTEQFITLSCTRVCLFED